MPEVAITDVETYVVANPWKPWTFVTVETDAGITGLGEATTRPPEDGVQAIERVKDEYIGKNPFETERFFTPSNPGSGASPYTKTKSTIASAMDIACWDIKAKYFDVPLYDLLGGRIHGDSLRTYANGWYTDVYEDGERRPELFAAAAEEVVAKGYDSMKFDPFGNAWQGMTQAEINRSIECVRAVREAVGPDVDLMIEGHKRFAVGTAVEIARRLAEFDVTWFEEPTHQDVQALRSVVRNSPVPIATGESMRTHRAFPELFETDVAIVQPDILYTGGVTHLRKIAAMADAEHVEVAPHNAQGPITTAATLHVDATIPNFAIQELFSDFAYPEWADDLLTDPTEVRDGRIAIPDGPGLGVELDVDAVREHAYTDDAQDDVHVIDLYEHGWEDRSLSDA